MTQSYFKLPIVPFLKRSATKPTPTRRNGAPHLPCPRAVARAAALEVLG